MSDKRFSVLVHSLDYCMVCGRPHPHKHEIFFGTKARDMSIKYGYVLPLCNEHHNMGAQSPHRDRKIDLAYKCLAQRHFEEHKGNRAMFIELFGKSYL